MKWRTAFIVDGDKLESLHLATINLKATDFSLQRVGDPRAYGRRGGNTCSALMIAELQRGPKPHRDLDTAAKAAGFATASSALHQLKKAGVISQSNGRYTIAKTKGARNAKAK